jgi:hypothetical protein
MQPAICNLELNLEIYDPSYSIKICKQNLSLHIALPNSEILNQYDVLPPVTNKWHFGHLHGVQKTTLTMVFFCYNIFVTHSKRILYRIIFKYRNSNMLKLI